MSRSRLFRAPSRGEVAVASSRRRARRVAVVLAALLFGALLVPLAAAPVAQAATPTDTRLFATTGNGSTPSVLYEIDPNTGATIATIGPVGYVVTGMEYDPGAGVLYASTSRNDPSHHGLITIDVGTGAGTPVGPAGYGLYPWASSYYGYYGYCPYYFTISNLTIDSSGQLYGQTGWPCDDTLVTIDPATGIATLVGQNYLYLYRFGMDFDVDDVLYVVRDYYYRGEVYTLDPTTGAYMGYVSSLYQTADHGDFDPATNLYYGLDGYGQLVVADLATGSVEATRPLDQYFHVVTFFAGGDLQTRKQAVRDELAALSGGDKKAAKYLDEAIEHLDDSLESSYWVDGSRLDPKKGHKVFNEERHAVQDLQKVTNPDVTEAIGELVDIDRGLAETAIGDAQAAIDAGAGGDPKELAKAEKDVAKAQEELADGDAEDAAAEPDKAIHDYEKAWKKAVDAHGHATKNVTLCHAHGGGYEVKIVKATNAQKHRDHGDGMIGEPVPGMSGFVFDETCQPVPVRVFARAWSVDATGAEREIVRLEDTNNDDVVSAGDTVYWGEYPTDFSGLNYGTYGQTSFVIDDSDTCCNDALLSVWNADQTLTFLHDHRFEYISEYGTGFGQSIIRDYLLNPFPPYTYNDNIRLENSPSQPTPQPQVTQTSYQDDPHINVLLDFL